MRSCWRIAASNKGSTNVSRYFSDAPWNNPIKTAGTHIGRNANYFNLKFTVLPGIKQINQLGMHISPTFRAWS